MTRTVLLCAGGTGGHLFPAEAVATVLEERGWRVELATDHRVGAYGKDFPATARHVVPSGTPSGRGAVGKATAGVKLGWGLVRALGLVGRVKPDVAAGFGGYPTIPPILAARLRGVPTVIHDQNAVLGRANRLLARFAKRIATATSALMLPAALQEKAVLTGNPVRPAVREAAAVPYHPPQPDGPVNLLIFGGSQGARFLSEAIPAAIGKLGPTLRGRLRITQQCRAEDLPSVEAAYRGLGIEAELAPFFAGLPMMIARSHLVIARSGATTVAELGVIGRPAILIPLPGAIDQDQRANAETLASAGGAWVYEEKTLGVRQLAADITDILSNPERLEAAAAGAGSTGRADGADRLADLIEEVAGFRQPGPPATAERSTDA